jgi:hydroxypyruvate reductase
MTFDHDAGQADQRTVLKSIYDAAVAAAHPAKCLPAHFPAPPEDGRLIIIAAGKAGAAMAAAAESHYADHLASGRASGLATTRKGYAVPLRWLEIIEAGHPVPDRESTQAAERALQLAGHARQGDLVLALISGGTSALWAAPVEGVTLAEKQELTRALLKAGAPIGEINSVRKHLSHIKGGRLAKAAFPAKVMTLAISDVPGDTPDGIGSGPTVPDGTTLADARAVLARWGIRPAASIEAALQRPENETLKADGTLSPGDFILAARPADALDAAAKAVTALGYRAILLGDALEGEAREVAAAHAALALEHKARGEKIALISGGELTVTVTGEGHGGPNQEYALALALAFDGTDGICALAADTDGSDGGTGRADDPAGAYVLPDTISRARKIHPNPAHFLVNNDSTGFFRMIDDLIVTGPTYTNVNDLRVILVEPGTAPAANN